jgi:hypothetical protein
MKQDGNILVLNYKIYISQNFVKYNINKTNDNQLVCLLFEEYFNYENYLIIILANKY